MFMSTTGVSNDGGGTGTLVLAKPHVSTVGEGGERERWGGRGGGGGGWGNKMLTLFLLIF